MAGNTIAQGSVLISLNADQFNNGIRKTGTTLSGTLSNIGKVTGSGFMKSFGSAIAIGGPIAIAALAVQGAGAIAGAAKDIGAGLVSEIQGIGKQGQIAKALGITPEAFTGIAGVAKSAGEDTREFIESLVTMGKLGSDAANNIGEVAAPAFAKLGLNAQEFIKLKPDEQFYQMFAALHKLGPGLDQTRLLMAAFGEDGGKFLLPLLEKTPEELRKMGAQFSLTGEQIKKATEANQSIQSIKNSFDMIWKRIAIAASPVIKGIADGIGSIIELGMPVFNWFERAWNRVSMLSQAFWGGIKEGALSIWSEVKPLFGSLFSWVDDLPTIETVITTFFRGIGRTAAFFWDTIKVGAGAVLIVAGNIVKGFAKVIEVFQDISTMGQAIPKEYRPKEIQEFIEGISKFQSDAAKTGQGLVASGEKALGSWGESAKQFDAWFDRILGKSTKINDNIVGAAAVAESKSAPMKLSGAIVKDSAEAYSLTVRNQFRDLMRDDKKDAKEQAKNTKKTAENTKQIKEDTKGIRDFVAALGIV